MRAHYAGTIIIQLSKFHAPDLGKDIPEWNIEIKPMTLDNLRIAAEKVRSLLGGGTTEEMLKELDKIEPEITTADGRVLVMPALNLIQIAPGEPKMIDNDTGEGNCTYWPDDNLDNAEIMRYRHVETGFCWGNMLETQSLRCLLEKEQLEDTWIDSLPATTYFYQCLTGNRLHVDDSPWEYWMSDLAKRLE